MLVLGIDPGTASTGYGLASGAGARLQRIDHGVIETRPGVPAERRLAAIHARVSELIQSHRPDAVAVEELFFGANVQTAFAVGQARGVVLLAAGQHGLPVRSYTPQQVKAAVCGNGRADKDQVGRMVARLLGLSAVPTPDHAADALAVAVCELNRAPLGRRPGRCGGARRPATGRGDAAPHRRAGRRCRGRRPGRGRGVGCSAGPRSGCHDIGRQCVIALISGTVAVRRPDHVVVDCGGVGYRLAVSTETLRHVPAAGQSTVLHTHLVVRDDALALYGFATEEERDLFLMLLGVQTVGPKVALSVLSAAPPRQLMAAVAAGDQARLRAPGVGKRTAERIIVELRERVDAALVPEEGEIVAHRSDTPEGVAREALEGLGYASDEIDRLLAGADGDSAEQLIAHALRSVKR